MEIGFNAQYLLDFLGAAATDEVPVELKDHESQGVFRPRGEGARLSLRRHAHAALERRMRVG